MHPPSGPLCFFRLKTLAKLQGALFEKNKEKSYIKTKSKPTLDCDYLWALDLPYYCV